MVRYYLVSVSLDPHDYTNDCAAGVPQRLFLSLQEAYEFADALTRGTVELPWDPEGTVGCSGGAEFHVTVVNFDDAGRPLNIRRRGWLSPTCVGSS